MNTRQQLTIYDRFRFIYQQNGLLTPVQMDNLYADNVVFRDPVHCIDGLPALKNYFATIGQKTRFCRFDFIDELVTDNSAHITWHMFFAHPQIAKGQTRQLRGMSLIHFSDGKIHYHEDCYDMGAMLYEHLPLIGGVTRFLKKRMKNT